jgi:hypothetical protein
VGSDFIRTADADVNLAIAHTMTLSSTKYHVKQAEFVGNTTSGNVVFGIDNVTLPLPSGTTEGDLLVAVTAVAGITPNTPSGWTRLTAQLATDWLTVFYKVVGASEPDLSFEYSPSQLSSNVLGTYSLFAYRGVGNTVSASSFRSDVNRLPYNNNVSGDSTVALNIIVVNGPPGITVIPAGTTLRAYSNATNYPNTAAGARNFVIYETQGSFSGNTTTQINANIDVNRAWSSVSVAIPIT